MEKTGRRQEEELKMEMYEGRRQEEELKMEMCEGRRH